MKAEIRHDMEAFEADVHFTYVRGVCPRCGAAARPHKARNCWVYRCENCPWWRRAQTEEVRVISVGITSADNVARTIAEGTIRVQPAQPQQAEGSTP